MASRTIAPMKATAGDAGRIPRGENWAYELKWDGMRIIAFIRSTGVRLQSSNGRDVTSSFPELDALSQLAVDDDELVLDGEVVAFDGDRPSFNTLQRRMHVADPAEAARRAVVTPVVFVVFDLLHVAGHDTMGLPLVDRRRLLEQIVEPARNWRLCEQFTEDPDALIAAITDAELEGIVAKRLDSVYRPGRRASDWVKIKPRRRQEFVVGGWLGGHGSRAGGLGSLLLGYYEGDELHFAGRAGSGLDDASIRDWQQVLTPAATSPFAHRFPTPNDRVVHWCEPTEVAEIAFGEWTEGMTLRHPVVLGRRSDKDPRQVRRERPDRSR